MKFLTIMTIFLASALISQELKIKANQFNADEKTGISILKVTMN
jgi:lipopolysaccharide export system protein LptA